MTMLDDLPTFAQKAFARLKTGTVLVRQNSGSEHDLELGGGFTYFTEPDHRPFPPASAKLIIEAGLVQPRADGLLPDIAQTFARPSE